MTTRATPTKTASRLLLATLLVAGPLLLGACNKQEQTARSAMESFCNDLSAGQWEKAMTGLGDTGEMQAELKKMEKDPEAKKVVDAMLKTANCKVVSAKDNVVTIETDTVDGEKVMTSVMGEMMAMAFAAAASGPEGQAQMEKAVYEKMTAAFSKPDAPRTVKKVDVKMEQKDGKWVPANDNKAFSNALVGGSDTATAAPSGQ